MSKEELNSIAMMFGDGGSDILYGKMSREMGLQNNGLNLVANTHQYLNQIQKMGKDLVEAGINYDKVSKRSATKSLTRKQGGSNRSMAASSTVRAQPNYNENNKVERSH